VTRNGQIDLRLRRPKRVALEFVLGKSPLAPFDDADLLTPNPAPDLDLDSVDLPDNVARDLVSYFPHARTSDSFCLDLGCGPSHMRRVAEHAGYTYVGIDYQDPGATLLGDAQALPFRDGRFACVWTSAVIQYVPFAFPMIAELNRVLAPGGRLLGSVAFLEAFDGASFVMYTQNGLNSLLTYGGFEIRKLAPDPWWTAPVAVSAMGLFPQMPLGVARRLGDAVEAVSRTWWRLGSWKRGEGYREVDRLGRTTACFSFMAEKPSAPPPRGSGPGRVTSCEQYGEPEHGRP
jgi:SAM-dependent methyltransferase